MRLVRDWESIESLHGGYASIGNFDGVHRGHQAMLNVLTSRARSDNVPSVAVTFDPHPIALLKPDAAPAALTTIESRAELLGRYGVDVTVVVPTDRAFLSLTAEEFFDSIVRGRLQARGLVEGPNFFFGRNRSGNITVLRSLCASHGLSFDVAPPVTVDEQLVSSSVIRSLLETGDVAHAVRLLGHPYRLSGHVGHGAQRGRTLGFPTANLTAVSTLVPARGVYAGIATVDKDHHPAAIHIGPNPTFSDATPKIEVHLLDFQGDLYDRVLQVELTNRVRDVQKFASVDALLSQLHQDIQAVRSMTTALLPFSD